MSDKGDIGEAKGSEIGTKSEGQKIKGI